MSKRPLPDKALSYFEDTLFAEEGAFPNVFNGTVLVNCRTFLPFNSKGYDENRLLDFDRGGIADQKIADEEMFSDICEHLESRGGSIIYFDYWSKANSDLIFEFESPVKTGAWMDHVFHEIDFDLIDLSKKNLDLIGEFRSNSVGYLKIIFTSGSKINWDKYNQDSFVDTIKSAISFYISSYDDETWIAADIEMRI